MTAHVLFVVCTLAGTLEPDAKLQVMQRMYLNDTLFCTGNG